jgi:single-stranded-DNA-specific exonuclease
MVAFLLMCRVRQVLLERAVLPASTPKLTELLPYVALGTVADCVSLATPVNRLVVQSGLKLMASSDSPAFRLIRERAGKPLDATFLAFRFGPLINAAQRVSDPHCSLEFLCATSEQEARARLEVLEGDNEQRKRVQREMMASALPLAADCFESSPHAVSVFLSDGHAGVQGIVASRLVERFGCPVAVMSPTDQPDVITGSARSIPDVDLKSVMDAIAASRPDCFLKYGGHAAAAGFSLHPEQIESFHTAFRSITESRNKKMVPGPELWTDGLIAPRDLQLSLVDGIESLGPWGRGWESPLFEGVFLLSGVRPVGRQHEHLSLEFTSDGQQWRGIWFDAGEAHADSLMPGILCRVVFEPQKNVWQGRVTLQLLVREMRPEREARPLLAEAGA